MTKASTLTMAALAAIAFASGAASAKVYTITFTGFLGSGTDTSGVFGTAGADLTHDAYTAAFRYDTSLGT